MDQESDGHRQSGPPEEGRPSGDRPKRRRRRGKRGSSGESKPATGHVGGAPGGSNSPPDRNRNERSGGKRRRRRRGGGGDGGGSDGSQQPAELVKRRRPPAAPIGKSWDEIFESRTFADLGLRSSVVKGCEEAGFTHPTKIQAELIPLVLNGHDVLGQSRTGSGKTGAFGLPLLHMAEQGKPFQAIILAPTRELAMQIAAEINDLGRFTPIRCSAVFGGQQVRQQAQSLQSGSEIVAATPGRLIDMVERGIVHFKHVRFAVLDEVDRMLDIGFRDDIKQILGAIKSDHQTVFVSATIEDEIEKLARTFMKNPQKLSVSGGSLTVSLVEQHYMAVEPWDKTRLLIHLLKHEEPALTVVFCRMKRTVDELSKKLKAEGIDAHAIHGDMYQGKRNSVMRRLREGDLSVVVASDLAARGLDVEGITHVVNFDLPEDPEVYIHRIGRTARAGRGGVAWSLVEPSQGPLLTQIEKLANVHIPEKEYPDFVRGQVPDRVKAKRAHEEKQLEQKRQTMNRYAPPSLPAEKAPKPDDQRFPGGLVPTKMPPRTLGGRVRTGRVAKLDAPPGDAPVT